MGSTMTGSSVALTITDEELQAEGSELIAYNKRIAALREDEYPMLKDFTYLDHAGTTLPSKSLLTSFSADLLSNLYGNPHSTGSPSSQLASQRIDHVRLRVLRLFRADPTAFDVIFVANATAGIKLVAQALADAENERGGFWLGYHRDAHTSLLGMREIAGHSRCFEGDGEVERWMDELKKQRVRDEGVGLFAYPAQSNMNGRRLPTGWCQSLRAGGSRYSYSLLDAAALASTSPLDLSDMENAPDFTVLSFYKMFGFPDLGALIVRKGAGQILRRRKYFGGGTVEVVACTSEQWHFKKEGPLHEVLEDGTLPIHNIIALDSAITIHERLFGSFEYVSTHTGFLARLLYNKLKNLRHSNGRWACEIYDEEVSLSHTGRYNRGPAIAFNFQDSQGQWVSNQEVQKLATVKNIHLRTGNLCNPGGVSHALGIRPEALRDNYTAGLRCGSERDMLGGKPTGVIRVSLGAMSTLQDIQSFLGFVDEFFVDKNLIPEQISLDPPKSYRYFIDTLIVYPIKSCGGWQVPKNTPWRLRQEGLAWDREWCLIHQGTRAALSQKRYPRMALFKPTLDFHTSQLTIRWTGAPNPGGAPLEISVPLACDPVFFTHATTASSSFPCETETDVCGDKIQPLIYASDAITTFFSTHLSIPVFLARFPSSVDPNSSLNTRYVKAKPPPSSGPQVKSPAPTATFTVPGAFPTPPPSPSLPRPLLLANESPLLVIFLSSLDALNAAIRVYGGHEVSADVFRANIILDDRTPGTQRLPSSPQSSTPTSTSNPSPSLSNPPSTVPPCPLPTTAQPPPLPSLPLRFPEDSLSHLTISSSSTNRTVYLSLLSPCRRCQMVCVDQTTGTRRQEPFATLAKVRRWGGGAWFGVYAALDLDRGDGGGRDWREDTGGEEASEKTLQVGDAVEAS